MKYTAMILALTFSTSALAVIKPVAPKQEEISQACPSIMNSARDWLRRVFGNPWVFQN